MSSSLNNYQEVEFLYLFNDLPEDDTLHILKKSISPETFSMQTHPSLKYGENYTATDDFNSYDRNEDIETDYQQSRYDDSSMTPFLVENIGKWSVHCGEYLENSAITALAFDVHLETIWVGQSNGRLSGYKLGSVTTEYPSFEKVISVQSSNCNLLEIVTDDSRVIVMTETHINVHSKGGYRNNSIPIVALAKLNGQNAPVISETFKLSKMCSSILSTGSMIESTMIVIGCDLKYLIHFLIESSQLALIDSSSPCSVCKSNNKIIVAGCHDGKVRIYDCRYGSSKILVTLDAHTGPVSDVSMLTDGTTLATCGYLDRYTSSSNASLVSDPLTKLFDLRTARLILTLSMTLSSPQFLLSVPSLKQENSSEEMVMMISSSGVIQTVNFHSQRPDLGQILKVPLGNKLERLSAIALSSTRQLIALGTSSGLVVQLMGISTSTMPTINSIPVEFFVPSNPISRVSKRIDSPSISSSFVLKNNINRKNLSSSFQSSPSLLTKKWRLSSAKRISSKLIGKALKRDFLYAVSNPGYAINSLQMHSLLDVYENCDPRLNIISESIAEAGPSVLPVQYRRNLSPRNPNWKSDLPRYQATFDYRQYNSTNFIGLENCSPNSYMNSMIQFLYLIPLIRHAALISQTVPFHFSNPSSIWCELGFLFHMMALKDSDSSTVNDSTNVEERVVIPSGFQRSFTQLPEAAALGLLGNSDIESHHKQINFIRFILQQLQKEVENESRTYAMDSRDISGLSLHSLSPITNLFSFSMITTMTFLQSNIQDKETVSSSLALDLIYSVQSPRMDATTIANVTFAKVVWHSLNRETIMSRVWCAISGAYEKCKQLRFVTAFPPIIGFICGENTSQFSKYWNQKNDETFLPTVMEIVTLQYHDNFEGDGHHKIPDHVVISCCVNINVNKNASWDVYDGNFEQRCDKPFSNQTYLIEKNLDEFANKHRIDRSFVRLVVKTYNLTAIVSNILDNSTVCHSVLHVSDMIFTGLPRDMQSWTVFNDFTVQSMPIKEALEFPPFRQPVYVAFVLAGSRVLEKRHEFTLEKYAVPKSVMSLPSLSSVASIKSVNNDVSINRGDLVAFDGEFVNVELSKSVIGKDGQRVVNSDGRQVLARMTMVTDMISENTAGASSKFKVLLDDYILPGEKVLDYVTRYSGITEDDLSPAISRHAIVSTRVAYLKLRYFVDLGVVFVGHGLQKDFEIANVFVPASQIRDTVELWRLPGQRKISLRFLASCLLKMEIQDEMHDSVEDAKTALQLYRVYESLRVRGNDFIQTALEKIYNYGSRCNWTIGLDMPPNIEELSD